MITQLIVRYEKWKVRNLSMGASEVEIMTGTAHENKDVIRRSFDAARNRDKEAFIELHAEDAVLHQASETIQGAEAIAEQQWAFFGSFPDVFPTPDTLIAEGDLVAAR